MLAAHIEVILLITGLATAGVLVLFLAPVPVTKVLFGQAPSDALGLLITRHWCEKGSGLICVQRPPGALHKSVLTPFRTGSHRFAEVTQAADKRDLPPVTLLSGYSP
jgi:hypothetical protein